MNLGRSGKGFGKLGAAVKAGTGGGSPPAGNAGEAIGLLLALTKAS
jgi:hypothetical protein